MKNLLLLAAGALALTAGAGTFLRLPPGGQGTVQCGAVSEETGLLSSRQVWFTLKCDDEFLYFGHKSALPEEPMTLSDGDEIFIAAAPPGGKQKEIRFKWSGKESRLEKGYWVSEARIPWADLGASGPEWGKEWRLQMGRDFQNQRERAVWSHPDTGRVIFQKGVPQVSFEGFGPRWLGFGYEITWSAAGRAKLDAEIVSIENPRNLNVMLDNSKGTLRAIMGNDIERTLKARITDPETGEPLYIRDLKWKAYTGPDYVNPNPPLTLDIAVYPGKSRVKARVTCAKTEKVRALGDVKFRIVDNDGKTFSEALPKMEKGELIQDWTLPALPPGRYWIEAFSGGKSLGLRRGFLIAKFPWQGQGLGTDRIVVPPFKPLTVKDGSVEATLTGYNASGALWDEIRADGVNLLASPVRLLCDGEEFQPKGRRVLETSPDRVIFESDLERPGLKLTIRQDYDYDGMCRLTFRFAPESEKLVDKMVLEFPLKAEYLSLFHSLGNGMRKNRRGFLPEKDGMLWESSTEAGKYLPGFRPYVWFGGVRRGLSWFAESPEGWGWREGTSALELTRGGAVTTLRVNLFNESRVLKSPFEIVMGVQPTPVKPQPEGYRNLMGTIYSGWTPDKAETLEFCVAGRMLGLRVDDGLDTPPNGDWSFVDLVTANKWKDRAEVEDFARAYLAKNRLSSENFSKWAETAPGDEPLTRMWQGARFYRGAKWHVRYINPRALCPSWPERDMYVDQWYLGPWRSSDKYNDEYTVHPDSDYIDFVLWDGLKWLKRGWSGLYYDNFYDIVSLDPLGGTDRAAERPVPYWPIFNMRELVKRTAVLLCKENKMICGRPAVMVHMTDCNAVPWLSFAAISLDWEMHYGDTPFPERFSEPYILTTTIGAQTGVIPWVLINSAGANGAEAARSQLALSFAYDLLAQTDSGFTKTQYWKDIQNLIRNFGYGDKSARVWPGWEPSNPVKVSGGKVRVTTVERADGQVMLLAGNPGDAVTAEFRLPRSYESVSDAVTGKVIGAGTGFSLPMEKYGHAAVLLKGGKQ